MFNQLLSVFLESKCPLCQRGTPNTVCQYCLNKLHSYRFNTSGWHHEQEQVPVFAWGKYDGQLKRAIATMKYHNHPELGIVLGELLAKAWLASNLIQVRNLSVIPIPLHQHKIKQRGFNQAQKIAVGFCKLTGYNLAAKTLIRVKKTQAMFNLNPEARIKNIQGAFNISDQLPKYPVLLLDDIYTMGTTIKESTKILTKNQIQVVGCLVIGKTEFK